MKRYFSLALLAALAAFLAFLAACGDAEIEPWDFNDYMSATEGQGEALDDFIKNWIEECSGEDPDSNKCGSINGGGNSSASTDGDGDDNSSASTGGDGDDNSSASTGGNGDDNSSASTGGNGSSSSSKNNSSSSTGGNGTGGSSSSNTLTCTGLASTGTAGTAITQPTVRCNGSNAANPSYTGAPIWNNPFAGSFNVSVTANCGGSKTVSCGTIVVSSPGSGGKSCTESGFKASDAPGYSGTCASAGIANGYTDGSTQCGCENGTTMYQEPNTKQLVCKGDWEAPAGYTQCGAAQALIPKN
jgi:hypothetical protein